MREQTEAIIRWHEMAQAGKSREEMADLYLNKLIPEEFRELISAPNEANAVKEAADLVVVCMGYLYSRRGKDEVLSEKDTSFIDNNVAMVYNFALNRIVSLDCDVAKALKIVNDSNMTKFLTELEMAELARTEKGVYFQQHEPGLFSMHDKETGKLLKHKFYKPVDEEKMLAECRL